MSHTSRNDSHSRIVHKLYFSWCLNYIGSSYRVLSFTPKPFNFDKIAAITIIYSASLSRFAKTIPRPRYSLQHRPILMKQKADSAQRDIVHASRGNANRPISKCGLDRAGIWSKRDRNVDGMARRSVAVRCVATTTATGAEEACRCFAPSIRIRDAVVCRPACQPALHWGRHIYRRVGARARPPPRSPRGAAMQARASCDSRPAAGTWARNTCSYDTRVRASTRDSVRLK